MSEIHSGTTQRHHLARRVITILCCGLTLGAGGAVGNTASSMFQRYAAEVLEAAGASVQSEPDHGIVACFGHSKMRETDAEQAVLVALRLISAKRSAADLAGIDVRIGIASGLVIMNGSASDTCCEKRGPTFLQASSVRDLAPPDTVLITEGTQDFVKDLFEYSDAAPAFLRNFPEPVRVFTVTRASQTENRFLALRSQRLQLFGRDRELSVLQALWTAASRGSGQAVIISGEQGMGKSRLTYEFERRLTSIPSAKMRLFASPHHKDCELYPFAKMMERLCRFKCGDTAHVKRSKLRDFLLPLGLGSSLEFSLFRDLLRLPSNGLDADLEARKTKKSELYLPAFSTLVEAQALQGALLVIFEDLHWADRASRELLDLIVRSVPSQRIMLIATSRPGAELTGNNAQVTKVELQPIGPAESAYVSQTSNCFKFAPQMPEQIIDASGGIPLFVEELTKAFLDIGAPLGLDGQPSRRLNAPLGVLPINIHAALLAQLDHLGEEKPVAQICAVLGQSFSREVLASVTGMSDGELNLALDRLMDAGLIMRATGSATYKFKQPLAKDAVYSTLSAEDCKLLHFQAAQAIKAIPAQREREPEALAHHLSRAGENMEAAQWWLQAGRAALARSAKPDAVEHLNRGLKLLRSTPHSSDRDHLERQLLIAIGPALVTVHGSGAPEPLRAFERAMKLTDDTTPVRERLQILAGLCNIRWVRSELYAGLALARQFFELAQASQIQAQLGALHDGPSFGANGRACCGKGAFRSRCGGLPESKGE